MKLELPTTRVIYKLPEILSQTEVGRLLNASGNIKHKTLLMIIYSASICVHVDRLIILVIIVTEYD